MVVIDIPKRRLVDEATDALRKAILEGRIQPGERLLQEKVAAMLGISRTPIREALQRLESEHLVKSNVLQGVVVTRLSAKDVEETYDVREVLDGLAARLAASRLSQAQLEDLGKCLDRMAGHAEKGERRRWLEANQVFHDTIARAAQNERLIQTLATVQPSLYLFSPFVWSKLERRLLSNREHKEIYEALASRNALDAERRARGHAQMVKQAVLDALEGQGVNGLKRRSKSRRHRT